MPYHRLFPPVYGLLAAAAAAAFAPAAAQSPVPPAPQVVTVGRGEVDIKPDRARLEFGVETRSATAVAAAAENSRRQRAVLDALQGRGVTAEQMQTANLQVTPEMVYPGQGQAPRISGYVARNFVRVDVLKLDQTGVLVDVALAKGATNVTGLQFYSSKTNEARREALARAVNLARLDADAMAKAAGYEIGALIEISNSARSENPVLMSMDLARGAGTAVGVEPTPINAGELKVVELVTVRWAVKR